MNNYSLRDELTQSNVNSTSNQRLYEFQLYSEQLTKYHIEKEKAIINKAESFRQNYIWKPKMPSKRLFEDPKFLLSMERKKVRVLAGLKSSDIESQ